MVNPRGVTTIKGKEPLRKTVALAVEYDTGELYYDRIGRILRRLGDSGEGWLREGKHIPNKTVVLNPAEDLLAEFGPGGASITLSFEGRPQAIETEQVERFTRNAVNLVSTVVDELEIEVFQRLGYRELYSFSSESVEESEEWLRALGVVTVADAVYQAFGSAHYALSWAVMVIGADCRYRIEMKGIERPGGIPVGESELSLRESRAKHLGKAEILKLLEAKRYRQTNPQYSTMLDIDAFLWDELDTDFEVRDFISTRAASNLDLFRSCLPS
jgi:hypothetical protein